MSSVLRSVLAASRLPRSGVIVSTRALLLPFARSFSTGFRSRSSISLPSRPSFVPSRTLAGMSSALEISTPTMKTDPSNLHVFQLVKRDHQIVNELFELYLKASNVDEKQMIAYFIVRELSQHSGAEEMTWYTQLEAKLGDKGKLYFDESVKEHQALKEDLEVLNTQKISEPVTQAKFEAVMKETIAHVKFEETSVLPDLEAAMTREELETLTTQWNRAKMMAPTRPHPTAGTPAPAVAAQATAMVDKGADALRFGIEKMKAYASEATSSTRSSTTQ